MSNLEIIRKLCGLLNDAQGIITDDGNGGKRIRMERGGLNDER